MNLYLTLNCVTASEHLEFDFIVLYNVFVLLWGLTITQNSIRTTSDLDRFHLTNARSTENASIGADTDADPEYRDWCILSLVILKYPVSLNCVKIRGRPIIGADIKHFTDYRYRPF